MNGRDFLPLAQKLLTDSTEAAWRSAVSRAYYAAFHAARDLLEGLGFTVPRGDNAHAYLWLRLSNCGVAQVIKAGQMLNDLRQARNRADYDLRRPFTQQEAVRQTGDADSFLQLLDALSPAERTQITDAMKIYERDVLKDVTWHP